MSKHTPGPWEIKRHPDSCYKYISAPEHLALAQVVWCVEEEDRSPACEANAYLIAAAPDLLEALEIALDCAGDAWWAEKAESAIAKAKGE